MTEPGPIDKKTISERDICTKFITPAIKEVAGWNLMQFSEELTSGKIFVKGKRVVRLVKDRADYILFHNRDLPIAIIEAQLRSAEEERGRLTESVLATVLS